VVSAAVQLRNYLKVHEVDPGTVRVLSADRVGVDCQGH
jgi:hypothetical protein